MIRILISIALLCSFISSSIHAEEKAWQLSESKVFSKLVGTWQGNWYRMNEKGEAINSYTSVLTQSIDETTNTWKQTNYYPETDETKQFEGSVVGPGQVRFQAVGGGHADYETIATEHDDYHIFWIVKHKRTNIVIYSETISLTTENERTRIGQRYSFADGSFQGLTLIHETRVLSNE